MAETKFDFDGKVVIVTGASSGIGAHIASEFGRAAAKVVAVGRDAERLDATVAGIEAAGGTGLAVTADLAEPAAADAVVRAALDAYGGVDVLAHTAGVFWPKPFEEVTADELDAQWGVNVRAPFLLTQRALPHLKTGSSVVFVSSMMGAVGGASCTAYGATKGAVEQLVKSLAVELGERDIRFNCVAPGAVETPMNAAFREDEDFYVLFKDFAPARRWGRVEDIAPAVLFLASDAAAFCHGSRLAVDGGWVAR